MLLVEFRKPYFLWNARSCAEKAVISAGNRYPSRTCIPCHRGKKSVSYLGRRPTGIRKIGAYVGIASFAFPRRAIDFLSQETIFLVSDLRAQVPHLRTYLRLPQ